MPSRGRKRVNNIARIPSINIIIWGSVRKNGNSPGSSFDETLNPICLRNTPSVAIMAMENLAIANFSVAIILP